LGRQAPRTINLRFSRRGDRRLKPIMRVLNDPSLVNPKLTIQKAETGAKFLCQFLSERKVSDQLPVTTKSPNKSSTGQLSSSTLTPTDLAAPWHGPQPRAEAQAAELNGT
jgi:hypothetical protein